MFKNMLLALVPMIMVASGAWANDDLLSELASGNTAAIVDAEIEIDSLDLDGVDVDSLANNADGAEEGQAIEACFRRFGYGHSYGGCYSYSSHYNYCPTYSYCQPLFSYHRVCYPVYTPVCTPVYTPVYTPVCAPVYTQYWGCY